MNSPIKNIAIFLFMSLPFLAGADTFIDKDNREWKKVTDKNDIQVYMSHTEDSKLKTFRGVTRMEVEDLRIIIAMLEDESSLSDYMHLISKITLVKMLEGVNRQFYIETSLPWPVKNRDTYVDMTVVQYEDYSISVEVLQSEDPGPLIKNYVRMPEIQGHVAMKVIPDSLDVELSYEMVLDPGGYIPSWIVNIILADVPYFTLKRFRRVVDLDRYKNYPTEAIKRRPWVVDTLPETAKAP